MKFGIITLVSDNYGNKYQNYAVETLMKKYGEVETFRLEECLQVNFNNKKSMIQKLQPSYIKQVLISRMMYRYDLNNAERSLLGNMLYIQKNKRKLLKVRECRHKKFENFEKEYLHISDKIITHDNTDFEWVDQYDYFICGSDQIWNPGYATTSDLAFLSFSPKVKNIALAPSFGVSVIPENMSELYKKGLEGIEVLSVREEAGKKIIYELTKRESEVLVDPTMAIDVTVWREMEREPKAKLPRKYILCYFLGRVNKQYKVAIRKLAKEKGLEIIPLFDIEFPEYYTLDPTEVLYCIDNAEMVVTDSFHGSVFSILFHKDFAVFERNEGGFSMNSRLDTLLEWFGLEDRVFNNFFVERSVDWTEVDMKIAYARDKYTQYLKKCKIVKE